MERPEGEARDRMVEEQILRRGVRDPRVLDAMRAVPRHLFVPSLLSDRAYEDSPLPIGRGQTISQPYIVAYMCERLRLHASSRVLEIGTGSGYQAAVLGELAGQVTTLEIVEVLYRRARRILARLGYRNVTCRLADGTLGAPSDGPFDAIIAAAAVLRFPEGLLEQLVDGGIAIYPEGPAHGYQELVQIVRHGAHAQRSELMGVRFVPMTGLARRLGE